VLSWEVEAGLEVGDIGGCSWIVEISFVYHRDTEGIEPVPKNLVQVESGDKADRR
jgi:hypothetical protein